MAAHSVLSSARPLTRFLLAAHTTTQSDREEEGKGNERDFTTSRIEIRTQSN